MNRAKVIGDRRSDSHVPICPLTQVTNTTNRKILKTLNSHTDFSNKNHMWQKLLLLKNTHTQDKHNKPKNNKIVKYSPRRQS